MTDLKWLNYAIYTVIIVGLLMMICKSAYKAGWNDALITYKVEK